MVSQLARCSTRISILNVLYLRRKPRSCSCSVENMVFSGLIQINTGKGANGDLAEWKEAGYCALITIEEKLKALATVKSLMEDNKEVSLDIGVTSGHRQMHSAHQEGAKPKKDR